MRTPTSSPSVDATSRSADGNVTRRAQIDSHIPGPVESTIHPKITGSDRRDALNDHAERQVCRQDRT